MGITGSCDETIIVGLRAGGALLEPDHESATHADFVALLEDETESVDAGAYVDIDPRGNDAFSF